MHDDAESDTKVVRVPAEITRRIVRMMERGVCWTFAEVRRPGLPSLWGRFEDLTVGQLEQLTQYHTERARKLLVRYELSRSPHAAKTAAEHIHRTRLYRFRYHELMGMQPCEEDMPFPLDPAPKVWRMPAI